MRARPPSDPVIQKKTPRSHAAVCLEVLGLRMGKHATGLLLTSYLSSRARKRRLQHHAELELQVNIHSLEHAPSRWRESLHPMQFGEMHQATNLEDSSQSCDSVQMVHTCIELHDHFLTHTGTVPNTGATFVLLYTYTTIPCK